MSKNSHTNVNFNDPFIDHTGINTNVVIKNGALVSRTSLSSDDMTSGQTSISYNNGIYTINFSFSNAQNTITGTYTGTLTNPKLSILTKQNKKTTGNTCYKRFGYLA